MGRKPTPEEIAAEMELEPRKVQWMLQVSLAAAVAGDARWARKKTASWAAFIEDDSTPDPDAERLPELAAREGRRCACRTLTPREARILRLRFGLQNGRAYTLEEVGQKFGLTRERIRQIEGKALRRLRHPRRARHLRDYLS